MVIYSLYYVKLKNTEILRLLNIHSPLCLILISLFTSCSDNEKKDYFHKMEFFVEQYTIRNHQLDEETRRFHCGEFRDLDSTYTWLTLIPKEWEDDQLIYRDTLRIDYKVNDRFELVKILNYDLFYNKLQEFKSYFIAKHQVFSGEQANKIFEIFDDSTYLVDKNSQEISMIGMAYCYLYENEYFREYEFKESQIGNMIYLSREIEVENAILKTYMPKLEEFLVDDLELSPVSNKAYVLIELVINPETHELFQARKTTTVYSGESDFVKNVFEMNIRVE